MKAGRVMIILQSYGPLGGKCYFGHPHYSTNKILAQRRKDAIKFSIRNLTQRRRDLISRKSKQIVNPVIFINDAGDAKFLCAFVS